MLPKMTCTSFDQLSRISLSDLPSRVLTDVFPTFAHVLDAETSVFIGVSAGVDSMTLACLLGIRYYQQHFPLANLHILHCNHQLRSQSEIEATYVHTFFS
jgi:hypothetical protein